MTSAEISGPPSSHLTDDLLRRAGLASAFLAKSTETLRQDASHRSYYRLRSTDSLSRSGTEAARSVILCRDLPFPVPSDFILLSRHLREQGIPVPHILAENPEEGLLLLSDGGESDLTDEIARCKGENRRECSSGLLRGSLELLVRLHRVEPVEPVRSRFFDYEKLMWEMEFLHDKIALLFPEANGESLLPPSYLAFTDALCRRLGEAYPRVFTHRDYHGKNILLPARTPYETASLTLVDYQDARMGLPWYDLASLLYDPYTPLDPADRREGYEFYTSAAGYDVRDRGNRLLFLDQATQRLLKALGSYLFLSLEKEMTSYASHIPRTLELLEEIRTERGEEGLPGSFPEFMRANLLPRLHHRIRPGEEREEA